MTINYKGKHYEIVELNEIGGGEFYCIVAIFECRFFKEENGIETPCTMEQFEDVNSGVDCHWRLGNFVNYFYCGTIAKNDIIEYAKKYIDEYETNKAKNTTIAQLKKHFEIRKEKVKRARQKNFEMNVGLDFKTIATTQGKMFDQYCQGKLDIIDDLLKRLENTKGE